MVAKTPYTITSDRLTTCSVVNEGKGIRLEFLEQSGAPVSVEFPLEQAHSIIMTLPRLLSQAVKRLTLDPAARFVFSLNEWMLESADNEALIATLTTEGGFAVSFSIPLDTCKALSFALRHEGQTASEQLNITGSNKPVPLN